MTNSEEIEELFIQLRAAGYEPELCDKLETYYDNPVMCGEPTMVGDIIPEEIRLPRSLWSDGFTFTLPAQGDSMEGVGIMEGDKLTVKTNERCLVTDIVLARLDNSYTFKVYYEDTMYRKWLLPLNKKYKAILLNEDSQVELLGKVIAIIKKTPCVSLRLCEEIVHETLVRDDVPKKLTKQKVASVIKQIASLIKNGRQWYALFRELVDKKFYQKGDYEQFCQLVVEQVPEHEHLPKEEQLQRMAILSFDKPVVMWDPNNAPVTGKRFVTYMNIAKMAEDLLAA